MVIIKSIDHLFMFKSLVISICLLFCYSLALAKDELGFTFKVCEQPFCSEISKDISKEKFILPFRDIICIQKLDPSPLPLFLASLPLPAGFEEKQDPYYYLVLKLNETAKTTLVQFSKNHIGETIQVIYKDTIIMTPKIMSPISDIKLNLPIISPLFVNLKRVHKLKVCD